MGWPEGGRLHFAGAATETPPDSGHRAFRKGTATDRPGHAGVKEASKPQAVNFGYGDLQHGDKVKIVAGPFAGYEGVFDLRRPGTDRVRLLLRFCERDQRRRSGREALDARLPAIPACTGGPWRALPVELNAGSIVKARPAR